MKNSERNDRGKHRPRRSRNSQPVPGLRATLEPVERHAPGACRRAHDKASHHAGLLVRRTEVVVDAGHAQRQVEMLARLQHVGRPRPRVARDAPAKFPDGHRRETRRARKRPAGRRPAPPPQHRRHCRGCRARCATDLDCAAAPPRPPPPGCRDGCRRSGGIVDRRVHHPIPFTGSMSIRPGWARKGSRASRARSGSGRRAAFRRGNTARQARGQPRWAWSQSRGPRRASRCCAGVSPSARGRTGSP